MQSNKSYKYMICNPQTVSAINLEVLVKSEMFEPKDFTPTVLFEAAVT